MGSRSEIFEVKKSYSFIFLKDFEFCIFSILIARAQILHQTEVDKRPLGRRLDPNKNFLLKQFDRILQYDDVHLPNTDENLTFTNHTWFVFERAFSKLFHSDVIDVLFLNIISKQLLT